MTTSAFAISIDINNLLKNWLTNSSAFDVFPDGKVNTLDFGKAIIPNPSPTPSTLPSSSSVVHTPVWIEVSTGFTDVTSRQIVRAKNDRVYIFGGQAETSRVLKAYWTTNSGLPTTSNNFNGTTQVTDPNMVVQTDAAYDGNSTIFVSVYTQTTTNSATVLRIYPFDISSNTFKTPLTIDAGALSLPPSGSPYYLGSGGVSGMFDKTGIFHIAYWSSGNNISHRAYTYNVSTNTLILISGPTQINILGPANHPHLAISPLDNSVTIAWLSQAATPQILARTKLVGSNWGSIQTVSNAPVWTSNNFGKNVDQGPSMVIDSTGVKHLTYMGNDSYGHIHYATSNGGSWTDVALPAYSHDPAITLDANGTLYIFGHGHSLSTTQDNGCKSDRNMCFLKKPAGESWSPQTLFAAQQTQGHFDASPSVKWSVVGWHRPEYAEFVWFRVNGGSYANTTIMYGRY
ncbi:MAG: hypothetical protein AAB874_00170 [Patescibacteria group bacterium]